MRDRSRMRAINALLSATMMALLLVHGVGNAFQMMGVGTPLSKVLSYTLLACTVAHACIGVVLTVDTLRSQREAQASYAGLNKRFWAIRVSGFAIAIFVAAHALIFLRPEGGAVRLSVFQIPQLVVSLLLVVSIAVHVLCNMEPLMVSLGISAPGERAIDLVIAVSLLLLLMGAGFVLYYLRWSVI